MAARVLYGVPASQTSRCMWALEELGLEYRLEPVRPYVTTRSAALLKLNPNGKVPVLVDGDLVLWESLAINLYLAARHGAPLWPESEAERALALQWSFWVANEVEPALWAMREHRELFPAAQRSSVRADEAEAKLRKSLELLEAHLAARDWVVGDAFSVADLNLESYIIRARRGSYPLARHPRLAAWIERCEARPARRQVRASIHADEEALCL